MIIKLNAVRAVNSGMNVNELLQVDALKCECATVLKEGRSVLPLCDQ